MAHDVYQHDDGTKCIFDSGEWFVPLDAGGEGYTCTKGHFVSNSDMMVSYKKGIADFVNLVSADYRKHTAVAVHEDMIMAIANFGIDPSNFFDNEDQQKVASLEAQIYLMTGKLPSG